jgi:hypothetical protein
MMKAIQGFIAVIFSCVLLGGIYIGSMLLGYFLAVMGIFFSIFTIFVCIICFIAYCFYELFQHLTGRS